jgi:GDP-4-dehydro-6-deoxy-D-mannose reductase
MRVVVTGAGGFIGSFLVEALSQRGDIVDAWTRDNVDVTDRNGIAAAFERFAPDAVVHLAARSLPGPSWENPGETYRVNVGGTIALLEAARLRENPPRVLLAGSSAEYAEPLDGKLIDERSAIAPNSPYGSSKFAAAQLGELYRQRYGLAIVGFRPFSLVGPRKTGDVCSDFARRIVAIERGTGRTMLVGDLNVVRDMIDVRDGVDGILTLIDAGEPGETYNICSGRAVSIGEILETYRRLANVPIEVERDPALLRPLEQKVKIGDPSKLRALGWAPERALKGTLIDILAYWRERERDI